MNKQRLLNAAKAARECKNPEKFTMAQFGHECGTPGCVMGQYAARADLQDQFYLSNSGHLLMRSTHRHASPADIMDHFEVDQDQACELFGGAGCDDAKTPLHAAEFIERFVDRHGDRT